MPKIAGMIGLIYPEIASARFINNLILGFCFLSIDRVSDYNSSGLHKSGMAITHSALPNNLEINT